MVVGTLLFLVIVAVAAAFLGKNTNEQLAFFKKKPPSKIDRAKPDLPVNFGYKFMWFAARTDSKLRLAEILDLKNISECNWKAGIDEAYGGLVFITPPINGWTLAGGWGLPIPDTLENLEEIDNLLCTMSHEFGEAQFFCTNRVEECHCWMQSLGGEMARIYSYLGEIGMNLAVEGEKTPFERTLRLLPNTFSEEALDEHYFDRTDLTWPDENLVMQIAAHWSIDPSQIENIPAVLPGLGLLGQR